MKIYLKQTQIVFLGLFGFFSGSCSRLLIKLVHFTLLARCVQFGF